MEKAEEADGWARDSGSASRKVLGSERAGSAEAEGV